MAINKARVRRNKSDALIQLAFSVRRTLRYMCVALFVASCSMFCAEFGLAQHPQFDSVMYHDPEIVSPERIKVFSPRLKQLWLEALARSEADLKRQAAETIVRAHHREMPGLEETIEPLIHELKAENQHPVVQLAVARALIVLDARQAAPLLWKRAQSDGLAMAQVVEPSLARWDYAPCRQVWLARLDDPQTSPRRKILAIRGLGTVGETKAASQLLALAIAPLTPLDIRVEGARSAGMLQNEGLEDQARSLAQDKSPRNVVSRLVAASLLIRHVGESAQALLGELSSDPEPAVAIIALRRLYEIDPMQLRKRAVQLIAHSDANIRYVGAQTLVADPSPDSVNLLGPMLNDTDVAVRTYVRESLEQLAGDEQLDPLIREQGMKHLETDHWRGLEQAMLLLVALDHKPAAMKMTRLLDLPRDEVYMTAAWSLRRLAVAETLDAMLDKAQRATDGRASEVIQDRSPELVAQLFQAFGAMKFAPSEPLMRRYVPKDLSYDFETRAAAVWALGHLHAGKPDPALAKQLEGRIADTASIPPEDERVRRMCAVSMGRMMSKDSLPVLRQFLEKESSFTPVGYSCGWAIQQITGEEIPDVGITELGQTGWFIEPLPDRRD